MYKTNIKTGLTEKEVIKNREKYGTNSLVATLKNSFFKQFITSLSDPIIRILIIALAIKTVFLFSDFDWFETLGIVIAIFLASFISTLSEYGSEKAFEKLQEESSKINCRVLRDGKVKEIFIDDVVVNDLVVLSSGDKIPADGFLIDGSISVDESSLNGESKEAYKEAIKGNNVNDNNLVYRGCVVYSNEAIMQVQKVGNDTFYGRLASEVLEKQPDSPLKIRLNKLAKIISRIGYFGAFLVSISYLFSKIVIDNHFDLNLIISFLSNFPLLFSHILYALTLSVTIIVVSVPEGLPMMITLVLSSNMKRMLKNNVLVRKLVGIETAGSINILFTDKTGTLTKGRLEVINFLSGNLKSYSSIIDIKKYPHFYNIVKKSLIYNNASNYNKDEKKISGGNITDRALLSFINEEKDNDVKIVKKIPFNSKNKYSMTFIKENNNFLTLIKGAPDKLLPFCKTYINENGNKVILDKYRIRDTISQLSKQKMRLLLLAVRDDYKFQESIDNLSLVGILTIKDEIRSDAIEGIKLVKKAGIQTVMITGDNKDTALAIAKELSLVTSSQDLVFTSDELKNKTDEEIKKILPNIKVVARSLPQDKSRLVRIAQDMNLVVGMTGDGVNDAPALKKADVGFAMGSGTEVSKEASDIVILDDNFLSISNAILFGRTIFKSIRKFIIFQLTMNLCAITLSIVGPFIGVETPVTVIQMLWINMVMDTLAGIAFAYEPPLIEYMMEKPKKKDESIINKYMLNEILFTGFYSALLCILFLKWPLIHDLFRIDPIDKYFLTAFFGLFIFMGIFNSFNARTHRLNLLANLYQNKVFVFTIFLIILVQVFLIYFGGDLFRTAGLTPREFEIMILIALTVIPVDWIRKLFLRFKGIKNGV